MLHKKSRLFHPLTLTLQTASSTILIYTIYTMRRVITITFLMLFAAQLFADSGQQVIRLGFVIKPSEYNK